MMIDKNDIKLIIASLTRREDDIYELDLRSRNKFIFNLNPRVRNHFFKVIKYRKNDIRILILTSLALEIIDNNITGDVAELGVYRGHFAHAIHALLPNREFYLLDTFEGFDNEEHAYDIKKFNFDEKHQTKLFKDTSVDEVKKVVGWNEHCHILKGVFPESAPPLSEKNFCFVSLDVDLYKPTKEGLKFFYPRLSPGGFMMVHDFHNPGYAGTHEAVMEFCRENHIPFVPVPDSGHSIIISKPL